jgi:GTP-binding protein EngB required for normal cell division
MSPQACSSDPTDTARVRAVLRSIGELSRRHSQEVIGREAESLLERAAEGRFFLAVVGQFKRGKSTLINALLGAPLLPTGVVPVTAVVTIVEYGEVTRAFVEQQEGGEKEIPPDAIADFITEERNPRNQRGVSAVVVRYPSPLLGQGVSLVDTPGVGSVFALNSAATHSFVPKIDAALVVLGADVPISADELDLVKRIQREVRDFVFVLNKADLVEPGAREETAAFCARVLREALPAAPEMLFVSAQRGLVEPDDPSSGVDALRARLAQLAERDGARLVACAIERGAQRLADQLAAALILERRALTQPLTDLEVRIETFRHQSLEMARLLDDLDYELRADVEKTARWLNAEALEFLDAEKRLLGAAVHDGIATLAVDVGTPLREAATSLVRGLVRDRLDAWLKDIEPRVKEHYGLLTDRLVEAANASAARIAEAAERSLGLFVEATPPEPDLRQASRLYYRMDDESVFLDPGGAWTLLMDRISGPGRTLARVRAAAVERAEHILHTNVTRIVDDLKERVEESLRKFLYELRSRLERTLRTAEQAQVRVAELRQSGAAAVSAELSALDATLAELERLRRREPTSRG